MISDTYMLAWKMGLKSTYYLRSLGATSIEKSTVDINKKFDDAPKREVSSQSLETEAAPRPKVTVP